MEATNLIKVDYDYKKLSYKFYNNFIKLFVNLFHTKNIKIDKVNIKESRKGFHILIKLNKDISIEESLLYGMILYSDPLRECFNYCRYLWGKYRTFNFFAKRKVVICNSMRVISRERESKRARKLKRKLIMIILRIKDGEYTNYLGKYF